MDLLVAAIRRHPAVLTLCLLATTLGAALVWFAVPVTYEAKASFAILPPSTTTAQSGKEIRVNPWQDAGGISAQIAASALASISESQEFGESLRRAGVTSTTLVEVEPAGGGVILGLSTVNDVRRAALADQGPLVEQVKAALAGQQAALAAPLPSYLRMQGITAAGDPLPLTASRLKLTGVATALGLILSLLAVVVADRRSLARAAHRAPAPIAPVNGAGALYARTAQRSS